MPPRDAPTHLEFQLAWLIERTVLSQPRADRRLNGIENLIAELTRMWRADVTIDPAREIRMASATRVAMFEWIEREEKADGAMSERLAAYADTAVCDENVPQRWVRVLLSESEGP